MGKTKVAHILHCVGGVEVSLRLILLHTDSHNFENLVIHGQNDTQAPFVDKYGQSVRAYKLPISRNISLFNDVASVFQCYKIIRREKPDVIHAHSAKGGIVARIVGQMLGIKVLFTPQAFSYLSAKKGIRRTMFLAIEKVFSGTNSILLASSDSERKRGILEVGYPENKAITFNNCIELPKEIRPLSIEQTWPDDYVCTVGRPCFQKNIDLMIRIFHEVAKEAKSHLVIMGVGHHMGQLDLVKNLISDLGLEKSVTLLPWTEREDVLHIISKSKLYISTARYEGLPYSVIESQALSRPCVVSDCDGNRDIIEDGINGFVVSANDIDLFKDRILTVLNQAAVWDAFSQNARQLFFKKFNIETRIGDLEKIYQEQ